MKNAVATPRNGMDEELIQRLQTALKKAGSGPLMVKQLAGAMGVSPTTAGKYVDIAEAKGLIRTAPYASAKQVWLLDSSGKSGVGAR
jgi:Mn-dependent DtxR family transcriptional regulator